MPLSVQKLESYESYVEFKIFLRKCIWKDGDFLRVIAIQLMMRLEEYFITQDRLNKKGSYYYFKDMYLLFSVRQTITNSIMRRTDNGEASDDEYTREYYSSLVVAIRKKAAFALTELPKLLNQSTKIKLAMPLTPNKRKEIQPKKKN